MIKSSIMATAEQHPLSTYIRRETCPCCGSGQDARRGSVVSNPPAETLLPDEHGRFLSGYDSKRIFFSYVTCGSCGGRFCPTYYDEAQLQSLYSRQAENMSEAPLSARQRTQDGYARLLLCHVQGSKAFLEIGADIGLFAEVCARAHEFSDLRLYEPNRDVHPTLAERTAAWASTISAEPFRADDIAPGSVSAAAAIHVLDHLLDPLDLLEGLRQALEPGGVLLVVTHDIGSPLAKILGRRWPPYTLQHPHLFGRRAMQLIVERAGLEIVSFHSTVNYFPIHFLAHAALSVVGLPSAFLKGKSSPLVGVALGNLATIVRKPA